MGMSLRAREIDCVLAQLIILLQEELNHGTKTHVLLRQFKVVQGQMSVLVLEACGLVKSGNDHLDGLHKFHLALSKASQSACFQLGPQKAIGQMERQCRHGHG